MLHDFGSSENVLRYIQEKSDDLEKAVIYPPGRVPVNQSGIVTGPPAVDFFLMLHFLDDDRKVICRTDAEFLLNDGILHRMKIKIEFAPVGT